jgi:hypothetical protein
VTSGRDASPGDHPGSRVVSVRLAAVDQSLSRLVMLLSRKQATVQSMRFSAGADEHTACVEFSARRSQLSHVIDALRREVVVIAVDER